MTGYGRGVAEHGHRRVVVEMKSVNHRYLDVKVRGAPMGAAAEEGLQRAVAKRCSRGSVAVVVKVQGSAGGTVARPDVAAARRVHRDLCDLADLLGVEQEVGLDLVCSQPGVMVPDEDEEETAELASDVLVAADSAAEALAGMREREGDTLARDLEQRLQTTSELADRIDELAAAAPASAGDRLRERIERLLQEAGHTLDQERLAQEVAVLADRQDVTEELVRLRSHVGQFRLLMKREGPVGRRMDFLVQELGREMNTIGSKSQSAELAALVVEAKAELEKIREQVQNIE